MASVEILREVPEEIDRVWTLCFQWCRYHYDDGTFELGYRFIWRRPNGHLQAARGQARIGSSLELQSLLNQATQAGWYGNIENDE